MGQPRPFLLFIFGFFKQTLLQFIQQIYVKNVDPVYGDLLEHESPPITTRPELKLISLISLTSCSYAVT